MDFSQIHFIYRAEGNANLVLYLPDYKKILRLPKCTNSSLASEHSGKNNLDLKDHLVYIKFMLNLLGNEYSSRPKIVTLSFADCERINQFCIPFRPAKRLDKKICGPYGILCADATFLPDNIKIPCDGDIFAIEIKPKQGWLLQDFPNKSNLFKLNNSTKCRYCAMQYFKIKSGKISTISTYCPLDLFSGNVEKIIKALDALFQFPQNNLRVFKNGILCYTEDNGKLGILQDDFFNLKLEMVQQVLVECLLKKFSIENDVIKDLPIVNHLPHNCILEKVLSLQLLFKKNIEILSNNTYSDEKTYKYLNLLKNKKKIKSINELSPIEQYIIGCTMMDCSIMTTFKEIKDLNFIRENKDNKNLCLIQNKYFFVKITILDIDPKPENHLKKYIKQTNQAYEDASCSNINL